MRWKARGLMFRLPENSHKIEYVLKNIKLILELRMCKCLSNAWKRFNNAREVVCKEIKSTEEYHLPEAWIIYILYLVLTLLPLTTYYLPDSYFMFTFWGILFLFLTPFFLHDKKTYYPFYIISQILNIIILIIIYLVCKKLATLTIILILFIPSTMIFLIITYTNAYAYIIFSSSETNETSQNPNKFLFITISFVITAIATYIGNNAISLELGLPSHDLPITTNLANIILTITMTTLVVSFVLFIYLLLVFKDDEYEEYKKFHSSEISFSLISLFIFIIVTIIFILPNYFESKGTLLKHIAYETDFQSINKYFIHNDIKNEKMKNILIETTTRVRLHENGHISLICIKEKNTLSEIHVFKYDDLEKNTSDEISKIINDCEQNKKESNVGTDMKSAPTKPPAGNITKE